MSDQALLKSEEKTLTAEEIKFYEEYIYLSDPEKLKPLLQGLSMLFRALEGQAIEPEDVFSGLLNIRDIRERTRYPSILDMKRHVTLYLIAKTYPIFKAFGEWAKEEEHHFISYPKGEGRKEGVEIMKAKGMIAQGISPIFLGEIPQKKPEGRFSRVFRKKEEKQA